MDSRREAEEDKLGGFTIKLEADVDEKDVAIMREDDKIEGLPAVEKSQRVGARYLCFVCLGMHLPSEVL